MVFGNGAGAVVLKRLPDALADGDHIDAVLTRWAVNNDGAVRAGFTAPAWTARRRSWRRRWPARRSIPRPSA